MPSQPHTARGGTAQFAPEDISQNKGMALLAYFGPLFLVPLLAVPHSRFARFHANQGLVLFAAAVAYSLASGVLRSVLSAISWRMGYYAGSFFNLLYLVFTALSIIGIVNAVNGRAQQLPVLGKITVLK